MIGVASIRTAIELQDNFTSVLYHVIDSVNIGLATMEDFRQTMNAPVDAVSMDAARDSILQATMAVRELDEAMQRLDAPAVRAPEVPRKAPVAWQSFEGPEVFIHTGAERLGQEVAGVNAMLQRLEETQARITQQAGGAEILPPGASEDIQAVESRLQALAGMINQAENSPLRIGTEEANAQLERLRIQLNQTLQLQNNLDAAMQEMDIGEINAAYQKLSQNVAETQRLVRDSFADLPPVEIPVRWDTDTMPVFTGSGIERFGQEVQGVNGMLEQLCATQDVIARQAFDTALFPPGAFRDLNSMAVRMDAIRSRIQEIENNPVNFGADAANGALEQLRAQLGQAVREQENLNRAVEGMDVQAANAAYLRLSQTVGNTERYIRDNVDEQGRFNREIEQGTEKADGLMQTIKGAIAAYATVHTLSAALNLSDQMTSTAARLDLMNDGLQTTKELQDMIYLSAQRSRGSYQETADAVSKMGLMAGDAFSSSKEIIAFMEQVNKQFAIAGTEASGIDAAMLQLTQAMGSGVLRGEEYNSILDQAPNIIQAIADYMEVPKGKLKDMAAEGQITAEIVKAAIFAATDETNAAFDSMPTTFEQVWTSFQNTALIAFRPILQRLNELANSESFQDFVGNVAEALSMVAGIALEIFDLLAGAAGLISDNWSWLSPIIYGVAAALTTYYGAMLLYNTITAISTGITAAKALAEKVHTAAIVMQSGATFTAAAAQYGFNAALLACPITWIILAIIALIVIIAILANHFSGVGHIAQSAFGVVCGGVNVGIQFIKNLGLTVANIALGIGAAIGACGHNIRTAFHNAISSVCSWWYDLLSTALGVVEKICASLNKLPFVSFDYSGISDAADDYAAKAQAWAQDKQEYTSVSEAFRVGMSTFNTFQEGWVEDAYRAGASWGDGITEKVKNFFSGSPAEDGIPNPEDYENLDEYGSDLDGIYENTGAIKDSMEIAEEELKYMRDIAEREQINRYTTGEITIEQTNYNTVSGTMDLDGIIDGLTDSANEAANRIAEGV